MAKQINKKTERQRIDAYWEHLAKQVTAIETNNWEKETEYNLQQADLCEQINHGQLYVAFHV